MDSHICDFKTCQIWIKLTSLESWCSIGAELGLIKCGDIVGNFPTFIMLIQKNLDATRDVSFVFFFLFRFSILGTLQCGIFLLQGTSDFCVSPDKFIVNQTKDFLSAGNLSQQTELHTHSFLSLGAKSQS